MKVALIIVSTVLALVLAVAAWLIVGTWGWWRR